MSNQAKEPEETGLDLAFPSGNYISLVAGIPQPSNASTTAAQVFSAAMERAKQMSQAAFVQEHSLLAEQLQVSLLPHSLSPHSTRLFIYI
jgi:hypothetical protein